MFNEISGEALKKRPLSSFIRKLWFILAGEEYSGLVQWVDHGQVICIPNCTAFAEVILPKLFKHNNWQSFVRQLNLYGFRKVYPLNLDNEEPLDKRAVWYFKHEYFQREKPDLLYDIKRQVNKSDAQEQTRQLEKDINESSNREIELELNQVKLRLLEADEKSDDLMNHIKYLQQMQSNQQEAIDSLLKAVSEVVANNKLSSETITETVNQIAHIKNLNKDLLNSSRKKRIRDEDEYDELEDDDFEQDKRFRYSPQPSTSTTTTTTTTTTAKDSFLSINSLIHEKEK